MIKDQSQKNLQSPRQIQKFGKINNFLIQNWIGKKRKAYTYKLITINEKKIYILS